MKGSVSRYMLFLLVLVSGGLDAQSGETIDWDYEIDLLGKELAHRHAELFFRADSVEFFRALEDAASKAESNDRFDMAVKLQQVVAGLGDPRTRINYHFLIEPQDILPMQFYWFEEGIHVVGSREEHREILGKRLVGINGHTIQEVADSLSTLIAGENPFRIRSEIPLMLTWIPLLDYFGFTSGNPVAMQLQQPGGVPFIHEIDRPFSESLQVTVARDSPPLGWKNRNAFFWESYFPSNRLYYIQYNNCWSREVEEESGTGARALFMPLFRDFEKKIRRTIRKEHIDRLVFDMRFNEGGQIEQGREFIRKLAGARYKGRGNIYLLIGRHTSGEAMVNVTDFLETADPVTIGEPTGGGTHYFGDVERFVLPESGLVVSYSTSHTILAGVDRDSVIPDICVDYTYDRFIRGIDPAIRWITGQP